MNQEEIIRRIDETISDLVYEKVSLMKAYNYYNCKRDPDQFRHLEMNYGIGTPTQIEFIPLVRKHIDALVGEYTSITTKPKISCKDEQTLSNIMRDKDVKIKSEVFNFYKQKLTNEIFKTFSVDQQQQQQQQQSQPNDPLIQMQLKKLMDDLQLNFVSDYEIAAQNLVQHIMQSRDIDFDTKKSIIAKDMYITGTSYFKINKNKNKDSFNIEVLNPLHTFIDKNPNSIYLKNSYRSVVRRYMNKIEILSKYGHLMSSNAVSEVKNVDVGAGTTTNTYYVRSTDVHGNPATNGIVAGLEVTPGIPSDKHDINVNMRLLEVLEVEWLDVEKEGKDFITYRYEGIRINGNIYIPIGKVEEEDCVRSISEPNETALTVNGMFFSDRNSQPFSLVLATSNLQDKYDILHFYRDNIIASSGTKGDWLDVSVLPTFLGADITERLQKFIAYKKQMGLALIDTSQEGRAFNNNTTFSGYDDTLQAGLMQAFDYAIQSIENTCSSITGVTRERLGGIEQKDAVTNVQVGVRQSSYITKQYYQIMDLLTREILLDILNLTKKVFKNGISGTLILGEKLNRIFTALPEHYTVSDHDIHIADSAETIKEQETIKQFSIELTKNGTLDPETLIEVMTSTGLTKMKENAKLSIAKRKAENDQLGQLNQQLQQMDQQLKQTTQEAQKLQSEVDKLNQTKLQLEQEKLSFQKQLEWYKAKSDTAYKDQMLELEKKRVQLEGLQLIDIDPRNNEIKNT